MGFTSYIYNKSQRMSDNRKKDYGLNPPRFVIQAKESSFSNLSFWLRIKLFFYIVFSSPFQLVTLLKAYVTDLDTPKRKLHIDVLKYELKNSVSKNCRIVTSYFERRLYSRDLAHLPAFLEKILHRTTPHLVVQPSVENDIVELVFFAIKRSLHIFPRGISSSAFGGSIPTKNGISLDMSCFDKIIEINTLDKTVKLQSGVKWSDLINNLEMHGLEPACNPTSLFSTVGGFISTGGFGVNSFALGHISNWIKSLRVILPGGDVKIYNKGEKEFKNFIGTEGQFGIISEIVLNVKKKTKFSKPVLIYFEKLNKAIEFINSLYSLSFKPSHVVMFNKNRAQEENTYFLEFSEHGNEIIRNSISILLHFNDLENYNEFISSDIKTELSIEKSNGAAFYLWSERYYPMKFQRLGPDALACELTIGSNYLESYLKKSKRLAKRFGSHLSSEIIFTDSESKENCIVISSFICNYTKKFDYILRLCLVQLLMSLGLRHKAKPYGLGIWNAPFYKKRYSKEECSRLIKRKHEIDPMFLLNPSKFFSLKTRILNIPGIFFKSIVYEMELFLLRIISPILGIIGKITGKHRLHHWNKPECEDEKDKRLLLSETYSRCVSCGSCIAVCPAYKILKTELVTARSKLRLADIVTNYGMYEINEAKSTFLCLQCGMCEEVCQTRLPLTNCYEVLEYFLLKNIEFPNVEIKHFIDKLEQNKSVVLAISGMKTPEWLSDNIKEFSYKYSELKVD